jgi:predicted AAA+ superfamily ATPase
MNDEYKQRLHAFLRDQISQGAFRTHAHVYDDKGQKNPERDLFPELKILLRKFLAGTSAIRWLVLPGLRGTGKTTLLAQLYHATPVSDQRKLFLSVDQVSQTFGATLQEMVLTYEEMLGGFERLQEPVFLFLDEVQYDPRWAAFLKTVYDRTNKVFVVATGSSAVMLNVNADVARRSISKKVLPLCFTEYLRIKLGKKENQNLSKKIKAALFDSRNAQECHAKLVALEPAIKKYLIDIKPSEIQDYINFGTLPYMVALNNEALVYDQIKKTLDRVVTVDIPLMGKFRPEITSKFSMLLYAIADSDQLSIHNLATVLEVSRPTVMRMLEALEQSELVLRMYPFGSHRAQVRKPSKYFFSSPAFRAMYFRFIGSTQRREIYEGKMIEDTITLYLARVVPMYAGMSLTFDAQLGGADFILRDGLRTLPIEAGRGTKSATQVMRSLRKTGGEYGLVVSATGLGILGSNNAVAVPLEYFLLI